MANPPSANLASDSRPPGDLAILRRVTAFGQELAGTLRRASVVDVLVRYIRETFAPTEIALSLFHRDADVRDLAFGWPAGRPDRGGLLELATRRGPLVLSDGLDTLAGDSSLAA
ncbi:MAG: hypothetical protein ACREX8_20285, partial [Gammaproteobacteria bacterium]